MGQPKIHDFTADILASSIPFVREKLILPWSKIWLCGARGGEFGGDNGRCMGL